MLSLGSGVLHRGCEEVGEGRMGMLMQSREESAEGGLGLGEDPVEMVQDLPTSVKGTRLMVGQVVHVEILVDQLGQRPQREEDEFSC